MWRAGEIAGSIGMFERRFSPGRSERLRQLRTGLSLIWHELVACFLNLGRQTLRRRKVSDLDWRICCPVK